MLKVRSGRRGAGRLLIAGAATITLDQRLTRPRIRSSADALAADWQAVGDDIRRALARAGDETEAA